MTRTGLAAGVARRASARRKRRRRVRRRLGTRAVRRALARVARLTSASPRNLFRPPLSFEVATLEDERRGREQHGDVGEAVQNSAEEVGRGRRLAVRGGGDVRVVREVREQVVERREDESRDAAADRGRERLEVCAEVADDEDEEGEEGRERGRGEGGAEERDGDEYQQLDVDERDRGPDSRDERPPAAAHIQERERDARAHHCDVDGERQAEAEVFSEKELAATDGLGEYGVDRAALYLFVDEADA